MGSLTNGDLGLNALGVAGTSSATSSTGKSMARKSRTLHDVPPTARYRTIGIMEYFKIL
jgi:hypothetical protein